MIGKRLDNYTEGGAIYMETIQKFGPSGLKQSMRDLDKFGCMPRDRDWYAVNEGVVYDR